MNAFRVVRCLGLTLLDQSVVIGLSADAGSMQELWPLIYVYELICRHGLLADVADLAKP